MDHQSSQVTKRKKRKLPDSSEQGSESQTAGNLFVHQQSNQVNSKEPVVTSKPPAPTVEDESELQGKGNFSSTLHNLSVVKRKGRRNASPEEGNEIDHILNTSSSKPYDILGLGGDFDGQTASKTSKQEIDRAFRRLAKRVHPDNNKDPRAGEAISSKDDALCIRFITMLTPI